jgi:NTP pyrophosphatase (non-canonical NTP hydrolase)
MTLDQLTENIKAWGASKGITTKKKGKDATIQKYAQALKVEEEAGELSGAILKGDEAKEKDGIGDTFVTILLLAEIRGYSIEECVAAAWDEIKGRKGQMVEGSFIKEA